jgi:alkylhydroperoxidase family enzyme
MAQLLNEIQWGEPLLPPVADPAWKAEVKRRLGRVGDLEMRIAPSPWLREAGVSASAYKVSHVPARLVNIAFLVTSQENSCRYCYGAARAMMKMMGNSESFISRIERDAQIAELDDRERNFILFCRNLARSMPRPAGTDREALIGLGFAPLAVNEAAFYIALVCFYNRVATLLACPADRSFERLADGFAGRLMIRAMSLIGRLLAGKTLAPAASAPDQAPGPSGPSGPFGPIVATLAGLPAAAWLHAALESAFASTVLPRRTKALMFAVVARSLACRHCETEASRMLVADGFTEPEIQAALATLASKRLEPFESKLLSWVRGTVHLQAAAIQDETRALAAEIGDAAILEAIGVAGLANMTVRLAMLLE